jgi:hypothetical protein
MTYTAPNANVVREDRQANIAGAASATMAKFMFFAKTKLKKVHTLITTAGTNATAGVDIYVGTTSVGAITHGTDTANTVKSSSQLDVEVPAGSFVELRGKANSATLVISATLEHQPYHDATTS